MTTLFVVKSERRLLTLDSLYDKEFSLFGYLINKLF